MNERPSPVAGLLQRRVCSASASGDVILEFEPSSLLYNDDGVVQGGIVAAMLDLIMGNAIKALHNGRASPVTVEMSTRFFLPVPAGRIEGHGRIVRTGARVTSVEGSLFSEGRLLATGQATKFVRILDGADR